MSSSNDAAETIQPTLRALEDAWRHGDGMAWAQQCMPDVDFINILGMYVKGRADVATLHQKIFDGPYKGSTLTLTAEHVRQVSGDMLFAIVPCEVHIPHGPAKGIVRTIATLLLARSEGQWLIASFHNTRREAAQPDPLAVMLQAVSSDDA